MDNYFLKPRQNNSAIEGYLNEVESKISNLDYYVDDELVNEDLLNLLNEDLPNSKQTQNRSIFIHDITNITQSFFNETESKKIRIQLQVIKSDMCRLFHVDHIKQRLLCTYKGAGTQWVENSNVNREWLAKGDNSKIIKDENLIKITSPFDIILLKGEKFNANIKGAVHRSSPIKLSNGLRIVLKLDEL